MARRSAGKRSAGRPPRRPDADAARARRAARLEAALAAQQQGDWKAAADTYRALLDEDPNDADAWHLMGMVALELGQHQMAQNFIAKAITLDPGRHSFHHNIAAVHSAYGRFDQAAAHYRETIRLRPDCADAYYNLSAIVRFQPGDDFVTAVEALLSAPAVSQADRCLLHFAAGKYHDDVGDVDRAFAHYREGNRAKTLRFGADESRRSVEAMRAAFPAGLWEARAGEGAASEVPLFVVGMPRSGTSLVEQMLAAHPDIHGAGELGDIDQTARALTAQAGGTVYPACVALTPPAVLRQHAARYLRLLAGLAPAARRVINKSPLNFRHLGLIALMFPRARIIHVRRDPRDTCLSCFFHNFRRNNEFSFDLVDLGHYYRAYEEMMAHWRAVLPLPLLEVQYEALVGDPEAVAREMLAFCGVEWHPACLEPHRVERPVETSSRWQVRQPITRAAVGRWRPYERHLAPLLEVLGPLPEGGADAAPRR